MTALQVEPELRRAAEVTCQPQRGVGRDAAPLARVLVPSFLADPASRTETVEFLMARGANPWQRLPFDPGISVVQYARSLRSPLVRVLDPPVRTTVVARRTLPGQ